MTFGNSKLSCASMTFCTAIYQPVVMPYHARCYAIGPQLKELAKNLTKVKLNVNVSCLDNVNEFI